MSHATTDEESHSKGGHGKPKPVKVKVSFPLAGKVHYTDEFAPETTAGTVRQAAMTHFGVTDDQTASYYLTLKGRRVDPNAQVGVLACDEHELKFTLAKELIQG